MASNAGMRAVSEAQLRAATEGGVPEPERIGGGRAADASGGGELWSVAVPMPGAGSSGGAAGLAYTLSTILIAPAKPGSGQGGPVTIVDPGWETPEAHAQLEGALAALGRGVGDIAHIVVTHAHPDHLGAAESLRRRSGARLLMPEHEAAGIERVRAGAAVDANELIDEWSVPAAEAPALRMQIGGIQAARALPDPADGLLCDGERLPIEGADWRVLWTPGHTPGHICLIDEERRLVMTGDHVLPKVFPGIGLRVDFGLRDADERNPIADYLASLDRLAPYDDFTVLPGHEYRFSGLGERRRQMVEHILDRAAEVKRVLASEPGVTVWSLASRLSWSAGWDRIASGRMLAYALLQTGYYAEFVLRGGLERI